ncbi:MAG: flagellar biosynthetic protein FliR [Deltaproteobacteria bacterium]|nr:flagellar biosynthetic protein FliR [Deltaproteobacteria bacterium]
MTELLSDSLDLSILWTWFLLLVRASALLWVLPGIGTSEVPDMIRGSVAIVLSAAIALACDRAPMPSNLIDGGLMVTVEFMLGYLLGAIPLFILSGLAVSGQVTNGAIGLGQANMIDHSLGEQVSVLSKIEMTIGTIIFLLIDGHHAVIRAFAGIDGNVRLGTFTTDMSTADILIDRFRATFELAVITSAPILVTLLVTNFVLGLLTKAVPQINIFIISLPLTIGVGLYIIAFTFPGLTENVVQEFQLLEELLVTLVTK